MNRDELKAEVLSRPVIPPTEQAVSACANGRTILISHTGHTFRHGPRGWRRVGMGWPLVGGDYLSTGELIDSESRAGSGFRVMTPEQAAQALLLWREERRPPPSITHAFREFGLSVLKSNKDDSFQWGTWHIVPLTNASWLALDEASPSDEDGVWPLRMLGPLATFDMAHELEEAGSAPLSPEGYKALQQAQKEARS